MRFFKVFFIVLILFLAVLAVLYTQRVRILDWYQNVGVSELPVSIAFDEVWQEDEFVEDSGVEDVFDDVEEVNVGVVENDEGVAQDVGDEDEKVEEEGDEDEFVLPDEVNLAVPFTSQAPYGEWDYPFKEACEEASVYMVKEYFAGEPEGEILANKAEADLLMIVAFENELFGDYIDTTVEQTGIFAEMMFGFSDVEIVDNPSVEDIKQKLALGYPVIVPAAGRLLGNPYFTAPGPIYHMLVIRGYTQDDQFITNDPGTRYGEAYLYDFDTIMYAMHDWNDDDEITEGAKRVLILKP